MAKIYNMMSPKYIYIYISEPLNDTDLPVRHPLVRLVREPRAEARSITCWTHKSRQKTCHRVQPVSA